jgi:uncharacterized protein
VDTQNTGSPAGLHSEHREVRIGLISDTHMPERLAALPPAVFTALGGVDLLLHAGDVGALSVLDELSAIAPVIAVHGNDDTPEAQRELPYQQLVTVAGARLLLTHAHYPDRAEELASRADDAWEPKLARRVAMAQRAEARIIVFGHTHIPMVVARDGVLLVNPGALAAPNYASRQTLRSVALLLVQSDGALSVSHIDLDRPGVPMSVVPELEAGFTAAHRQVTTSILTPELEQHAAALRAIAADSPKAMQAAIGRVAHRCWSGAVERMGPQDLLDELAKEPMLPAEVLAQCVALLGPTRA